MCLTMKEFEQSCGFLLINDSSIFIYCCKMCFSEFDSGSELEAHLLCEHFGQNKDIEVVYVANQSQNRELVLNDDRLTQDLEDFIKFTEINKNDESDDEMIEEVLDDSMEQLSSMSDNDVDSIEHISTAHSNESTAHESNDENVVIALEIEATNSVTELPKKGKRGPKPGVKRKDRKKSIPTEVFYCDMCPSITLRTLDIVKQHMKRHREKRLLKKCPMCNQRPRNFEKHMQMKHLNNRPYKCGFCDASFRTNLTRIVHIRGHTNEKPYSCDICGKAFSSQSGLYKHGIQVHTIQRPHPCSQCDRHFGSPSELREHTFAIHSLERPYICDICHTRYSTKYNLRLHKLTHGEKTKPCRFCEKKFKTAGCRRSHEKQVHKVFHMQQQYRTIASKRQDEYTNA